MRRYNQPTYKMSYFFFIGEPREKVAQFLKRKFNLDIKPSESNGGECIRISSGEALYALVIWTEMKKNQKGWASTIGHECLHAANITLHDRGVQPTYENDEPQSYLMSELIDEAEKAK